MIKIDFRKYFNDRIWFGWERYGISGGFFMKRYLSEYNPRKIGRWIRCEGQWKCGRNRFVD